jgi:hypothetical protein
MKYIRMPIHLLTYIIIKRRIKNKVRKAWLNLSQYIKNKNILIIYIQNPLFGSPSLILRFYKRESIHLLPKSMFLVFCSLLFLYQISVNQTRLKLFHLTGMINYKCAAATYSYRIQPGTGYINCMLSFVYLVYFRFI